MARRKKEELELEEDLLDTDVEEEEELEEPHELSASEDDEDEDEDEDEELEASADDEDEDEEVEQVKPKKAPRKRRAAKPKKVALEASQAGVETKAPAVAAAVAVPAAPVAATPSVDAEAMIKQWEAVQKASESIVASLEKVNGMLREIPEHYTTSFNKALKNNTPRSTAAGKIAFTMSALATILSVLSISFSQSARQEVLMRSAQAPALHAPQTPSAPIAAAPAPKKERRKGH